MGKDPADVKAERGEFLAKLGLNPAEALRYWKRLKPKEDLIVISYMTMAYGVDFAKMFKQKADANARPDLSYTVTNLPYVTSHWLTQRGYKFQRKVGNSDMEIWVHPSGHEYWRIPAAKAAPQQPIPGKNPPTVPPLPPDPHVHPDVEEMRMYVKEFTKRKNELVDKAKRIEALRPTLTRPQYDKLRQEWWDQYQADDEDHDDILNEVVPDLGDGLTPAERKLLDDEIQKFKDIWSSWPFPSMNPPKWGTQPGESP